MVNPRLRPETYMENQSQFSSQTRSSRSKSRSSSSESYDSSLDSLAIPKRSRKAPAKVVPASAGAPSRPVSRPVVPTLSYASIVRGDVAVPQAKEVKSSKSHSASREQSPERGPVFPPSPTSSVSSQGAAILAPAVPDGGGAWVKVAKRGRKSSTSSSSVSSSSEGPKKARSDDSHGVILKMSNKKFLAWLHDPKCAKCDKKNRRPCVECIRYAAGLVGPQAGAPFDRIVEQGIKVSTKFGNSKFCGKCAGRHDTGQHKDVKSKRGDSSSTSETTSLSSLPRTEAMLKKYADSKAPASPVKPRPKTPPKGKAPKASTSNASTEPSSPTPVSKREKKRKAEGGTRASKKAGLISKDASEASAKEAGARDAAREASDAVRALAPPVLDAEALAEIDEKLMKHPVFIQFKAFAVMNDVVPDCTNLAAVCECTVVKTLFDAVFLRFGGTFELVDWMRFSLVNMPADWVEVLCRDLQNVYLVTNQFNALNHRDGIFGTMTAKDFVVMYPARYHFGPPSSPPNGGPSSFLAQKVDTRVGSQFAFAELAHNSVPMPLDLPLVLSYGRQLAHSLLTTLLPTAGALALIGRSRVAGVPLSALLGAVVGSRLLSNYVASRRQQVVVHEVEVVETPRPLTPPGDGRPDAMMFGPVKHVARPLRVVHNAVLVDREIPGSFFSPFPDDGVNAYPKTRFYKNWPAMGWSTAPFRGMVGRMLLGVRFATLLPFGWALGEAIVARQNAKELYQYAVDLARTPGMFVHVPLRPTTNFFIEVLHRGSPAWDVACCVLAGVIMQVVVAAHSVRPPAYARNPVRLPGVIPEYAGLMQGFPADGEVDVQLKQPRVFAASAARKDVEAAIRRHLQSLSSVNLDRNDNEAHMVFQGNLILTLLRWAAVRADALPDRLFVDGSQGGAQGPN